MFEFGVTIMGWLDEPNAPQMLIDNSNDHHIIKSIAKSYIFYLKNLGVHYFND